MDDAEPPAAHFDAARDAWVLSTWRDVSAALRDARLVAGDATPPAGAAAAHATVRVGARTPSPERLAAWRATLETSARAHAGALPHGKPIDLVADFAAPWSRDAAIAVAGAAPDHADALAAHAREIFLAAAHATDATFPAETRAAAAELARRLPDEAPWGDVQAFVALSHTLPAALAGAWARLFRAPAIADALRAEPARIPAAVDELLRHAGPARAVFRRAAEDVVLGDARIPRGARVVLRLDDANHDAARFAEPARLDPDRENASSHLAFGRGTHGCPGAPLVRMAVAVATEALLATATAVSLLEGERWDDGYAIRVPVALPAMLRRTPDEPA